MEIVLNEGYSPISDIIRFNYYQDRAEYDIIDRLDKYFNVINKSCDKCICNNTYLCNLNFDKIQKSDKCCNLIEIIKK